MKIPFPKLSKKVIIPITVLILLIIAVLPAYYFYSKYQESQKLLQNPAEAAQEGVKKIVEKVGRLIELPADEVPTVATVSDKEKLKEQVFFAKSENGDKVLIFTQAKKAILFRPNTNKIIEVAPINLGPAETATASASLEKIKVALYNGTDTVGLTQTAEKMLKSKLPNIEVVLKDNAKNKGYQKTLVVDLTGTNVAANLVTKAFNAEIAKLPDGEEKPLATGNGQVDILVILGKDYTVK